MNSYSFNHYALDTLSQAGGGIDEKPPHRKRTYQRSESGEEHTNQQACSCWSFPNKAIL